MSSMTWRCEFHFEWLRHIHDQSEQCRHGRIPSHAVGASLFRERTCRRWLSGCPNKSVDRTWVSYALTKSTLSVMKIMVTDSILGDDPRLSPRRWNS